MRAARVFAAFIAGMLCGTGVAWSQAYPVKPVRVIVLAQRLKTDYELIGKLLRQFGVRLD